MGLWKSIRGEFVDIIEWIDDTHDTMVFRFDRAGNEIKYGAKLIVREGQVAVFIDQGQLADTFFPGTYTLITENMPILTKLKNWKHGFESPYKAEVYFVSTKRFTDLKWGTKNPIIMRDPEFGPIRVRAFGTYAVQIAFAATLLREIVGTDGVFTLDEITNQLRNLIVSRFADVVAERKIPILDLAADYDEMGAFLADQVKPDFEAYGLNLTKLLVENVSLPPQVEEALDKRTSMGIVGNLNQYQQFQAANAMEAAAKQKDGAMGSGLGMGMGFGMANQMANQMAQNTNAPAATPAPAPVDDGPGVPPPIPSSSVLYFLAIDGQRQGPFDDAALVEKAQAGILTESTMVWSKGMAQWTQAGEVAGLKSALAHVPPPLPPS